MPVYDYVCGSCGHVVEVIHAISAPGPSACERCGGAMKRALSAPAIVFKGSGWAKKDARDAGRPKTKPAADTTTARSGEGSPSKGTEGAATTGASGSGGATRTGEKPSTAASTTTTSGGSSTASG